MSLNRKLLIAIISAALFGITLFGYVSYQSAQSVQRKLEITTIQTVAKQLALFFSTQPLASTSRLIPHPPQQDQQSDYYIVITNNQGQVVTSNKTASKLENTPYKLILQTRRVSGYIKHKDSIYIWGSNEIPRTSRKLTVLQQINKAAYDDFFEALGIPFLIAGLILLSIAILGAIILSSLIKRIDRQKQELEHQTLHDSLTGLPNRNLLIERADNQINASLPEGEVLALMMMNMNRFKEVNDTLGHYYGDNLLCQIASRLKTILRETDMAARLFSDEFAILIAGARNDIVGSVAPRILDSMNQAFKVGKHDLYLGTSLGIAFYPEDAVSATDLIQHADMAMSSAKRTGTGYTIYDENNNTSSLGQLKLINDLRNDIEHGRLELHYQPKIDLLTGETVSVEALVRWHHPEHGHIAPSRFVHIAENTGLITPLTYWVLNSAIGQCRLLHKQGFNINMAINLSPWNLQDKELSDHIRKLLEEKKVNASDITLEITETAMMVNRKRALATLHQFDGLNLHISIDDFGTGYSSLSYIRKLPLSEVKIDKSFIKTMTENSNDTSLVRAIIDLAHDFGLNVVAEGVENENAVDQLRKLGCDIAQGYYFARPLPYSELIKWLTESKQQSAIKEYS